MKLTSAMRSVLADLSAEPSSSYLMGVSLSTLHALERRGMVKAVPAPGNFAFPHTATWQITPAGRQALATSGGTNDASE